MDNLACTACGGQFDENSITSHVQITYRDGRSEMTRCHFGCLERYLDELKRRYDMKDNDHPIRRLVSKETADEGGD